MFVISRECKLDTKLSQFEIYRVKKILMHNRVDDMYIITNIDVTEDYLKIDFGINRYEEKHREKIESNQILVYYLSKYIDYKFETLKYISGISKELNKKDEIYESTDFDAIDFSIFLNR